MRGPESACIFMLMSVRVELGKTSVFTTVYCYYCRYYYYFDTCVSLLFKYLNLVRALFEFLMEMSDEIMYVVCIMSFEIISYQIILD